MSDPLDREPRLAVALDTAERDELEAWCRFFGPRVGVLKVGLEAFLRFGAEAVTLARRHAAAVFLDLKLHDIPNTVAGAVRSLRSLEVDYVTVHVSGGRAMLEAAVEAAGGAVKLLGVTVLTHLDAAALIELGLEPEGGARVDAWTRLAFDCGLAGAVCSPLEAASLRRRHPRPFLLVTPGIRLAAAAAGDDQRRVATPELALRDGADLLVVGRPLTQAPDPDAALRQVLASMHGAGG